MKKTKLMFLNALFFLTPLFSFATDYVSGNSTFLEGHDVVSYITENKAEMGKKEFSYIYEKVTFNFKSNEHKDLFIKDPEKYIPAYKGWCAYAMAQNGKLVSSDPKSFKVTNGKTYLFYNGLWGNTLKKWNQKEIAPQIKAADKKWAAKHK